MSYWPWWLSGAALASVMVFHWLSTGRMMAVSGRFSALVNRVRVGKEEAAPEMSSEDLLLAIQSATLAEFDGLETVDGSPQEQAGLPLDDMTAPGSDAAMLDSNTASLKSTAPMSHHALFFFGLVLGGTLGSVLSGTWGAVSFGLRGAQFQELTQGRHPLALGVLLFGGMLVGAGTRMAGGCTSGHGLCGVSRVQPGSLLATASFFGVGIIVSLCIGVML